MDAAAYRRMVEEEFASELGRAGSLVDDLDRPLDAAGQMAADLDLLDAVAAGARPCCGSTAGGRPRCPSAASRPTPTSMPAACARLGVEVVRRPTGGRALLHGGDLTYAVALPAPTGARRASTRSTRSGRRRCRRPGPARRRGRGGAPRGAGRRGVHGHPAGRRPPGGGPQGLRLGPGPRGGGVLQHGSILLDRLPFDETDLVVGATHDRDRLRAATVTLAELGAPPTPGWCRAVVEGFRGGPRRRVHLDRVERRTGIIAARDRRRYPRPRCDAVVAATRTRPGPSTAPPVARPSPATTTRPP